MTVAPLRLVVVGSINIDLVATAARLPSAGETVGEGLFRREPGGKGANQAAAAGRLGASVRMIGAVGFDSDGDIALSGLGAAGVDTSSVRRVDRPTGTAVIMVDAAGENQIVVCPGANNEVRLGGSGLADADAVLAQLEVPLELIAEVAARAPAFLAINAAPAQPLPAAVLQRADLIIVNEHEYRMLPALADARLVAVTYGAAGAALLDRGHQLARVAAPKVVVVNSVGAGDAFCAALTIALARGDGYTDALTAACAVGAAAVSDAASQPALGTLDSYRVRTH